MLQFQILVYNFCLKYYSLEVTLRTNFGYLKFWVTSSDQKCNYILPTDLLPFLTEEAVVRFYNPGGGLFFFLFSFLKLKIRGGGAKAPSAPTLTTPLQVTGKWFSNSFGSHSTVQQIMPFPYSQDYQYVRCRKDFISEKSGFHLMFMYCNHFSWKYPSEYFDFMKY